LNTVTIVLIHYLTYTMPHIALILVPGVGFETDQEEDGENLQNDEN